MRTKIFLALPLITAVCLSLARPLLADSKTIVLNNDQIKNLPTTLITIIPAPSLGKVILPDKVLLYANPNNVDYGNYDGKAEFMIAFYDGSDWRGITSELVGPASDPDRMHLNGDIIWCWPAGEENDYHYALNLQPNRAYNVVVAINNPISGNLTGGNPANTVKDHHLVFDRRIVSSLDEELLKGRKGEERGKGSNLNI